MSETKKKTAAPKPVSKKPYLTGKPLDSSCIGGALRFFLYLLMMAIAFLFLGAVLSFDSFTLRLIINLAVVLLLLTVMFQSGAAAGSVAVSAGELAYQRKESNRMLNDAEIRACYHPLKGFLTALIGSLPAADCRDRAGLHDAAPNDEHRRAADVGQQHDGQCR